VLTVFRRFDYKVRFMIARGGRLFVALSVIAAIALLPIEPYATVGIACLAIVFMFVFRDPRRTIGDGIVAPADGRVREVDPERGLVSTYLALRNVHVTRAPIEGVVIKKDRAHGKHSPAFSRMTEHNERLEIALRTALGEISMVQMTGAIARRIVPYIDVGQNLRKGEKLSLIRFGSRVDLFLPPTSVNILVKKGDRLRGGVTPIAEVRDGRME
jgi:phosphatidylserine decarboxylase